MDSILSITEGITENQIEELIKFSSTDDLIQSTTSDAKRFKDKKAFDNWFKKEKQIYVLSDETKKLLGIIWFGQKQIPKKRTFTKTFDKNLYGITFAIRIYDKARGKGYSKIFLNSSLEKYKASSEFKKIKNNKMWLETSKDNLRAISTYVKAGFVLVSKPDETDKVIMRQF